MLMQFLYSLPLFMLAVYGVVEISEFGFFLGAAEQASFFSARSQFVGEGGTEVVEYFNDATMDPVANLEGRTSPFTPAPITPASIAPGSSPAAAVELKYPEGWLFPENFLLQRPWTSSIPAHVRTTPIPNRGVP
ncbi:MAG TPA: hypothetical protein VI895_15120 [Bdellovibrionota bacterium]|nr:hypothetical protein [Bdellovibrionota bacterium]